MKAQGYLGGTAEKLEAEGLTTWNCRENGSSRPYPGATVEKLEAQGLTPTGTVEKIKAQSPTLVEL